MSTESDIKKMKLKMEKIRDEITSAKSMDVYGKEAVSLIKKRTRLGFGVEKHGVRKKKLDKLSEGYKTARKRNKPTGPTTPSKSNLTRTGDMLDDLEPQNSMEGRIKIGFKSELSEDKAGWVSEDRPFNNLSSSEIKQMNQLIQKRIKKILDK